MMVAVVLVDGFVVVIGNVVVVEPAGTVTVAGTTAAPVDEVTLTV